MTEKTPIDDNSAVKDNLRWLAGRMRTDGGFLNPLKFFATRVEGGISKVDTLPRGKVAALRVTLDAYRMTHPKVDQRSLLELYKSLKDLIPEGGQ